ncbi:MAG: hypothetical protein V2I97_13325 [Desulfococcaceae bacterium]|jgi:hypothetical protein|nr:hypothetical protein [Desulfococcaceae bacterium]
MKKHILIFFLLFLMLAPSFIWGLPGIPDSHAASFPPPELLDELQKRILESEDCFHPSCAVFSRMEISTDAKTLDIRLEVHAAKETAVPLPGSFQSWMPRKIFMEEAEVRTIIRDPSGTLWIRVPKGIHQLHLQGPAGPGDEIRIPLPLKPYVATAAVSDWDVQGIHPDGKLENAIQLIRQKKSEEATKIHSDVLPPFLEVQRSLRLGIQWEAETRIRRLSPAGSPILFSLPLLPGESVTTQGIHVKEQQALVNMSAQQQEISWISALENTKELILQAADTETWTEIWVMDASPIWHLEFSGIPPVHQQDAQGVWNPTWRPLPGESIQIRISRPPAMEGRTVTIDSAELKWTPGNRIADAQLKMKIRSAKGERHTVTLPEGAELQQVKISGESKSIRPEGRKLILPLKPGMQEMEVQWQQNRSLSFMEQSPELHTGSQAVNARVIFHMPSDRWILLTGGPRMGPAVLFWSYFFVILIAGFALGKISLTPLKSWQWMLLGLGLTQIHVPGALLIVGWFLALGLRKKDRISERVRGWFFFNLMQICLAGLTVAAMICFYLAIQKGLLGTPEMQISGNGSNNTYLYWTQDRIEGSMPQPWVISLPRFTYHLFMLIWSLWLATAMIRWLRWGWECFGHEKLWERIELKFRKKKGPPTLANS